MDMPPALATLLTEELKLDGAHNVLHVDGLLDLADLSVLPVRRPALPRTHLPSPAPSSRGLSCT